MENYNEIRTAVPEFSEPTKTEQNSTFNCSNTNDIVKISELNEQNKKRNNEIFNTNNLDIVQYPNHYGAGKDGLQCIEAMLQTFGKDATMAFCKLNSFKYIWRATYKGKEKQDMEKAQRYLEYWHVLNDINGDKDDGSFHTYLNKR